MLFADIKGSTAAAETLDPEDWAQIVNGAFERLIAPVYRYEGTLAQLQGDAVLAFFGAPIAHEDDPVRALRAGLEIVEEMRSYSAEVEEAWGFPLVVRVGVNTGLVVVGEVGSDLRVEYTALGDAINVAARMEQTADPGTVRATQHTLALTGEMFEVEDLGPIEVKGKADPVNAGRVVRFVGGSDDGQMRGMVGREAELRRLGGLVDQLLSGSGWIASVIAEAGVGKSRLLRQLRSDVEAETPLAMNSGESGELSSMFSVSRSYDSETPLSTIRDLLRRWWSVDGTPGDSAIVQRAVSAAGLDDPDAPTLLAYVAGLPLSDEESGFIDALMTPTLHGKAVAAVFDYLSAEARIRPLLLVFEDLHWADDLSLGLVDNLMQLTEQLPVGLLVAMRPYREEPTWHIHEVADRRHHHRYHKIELAPLSPEETAELVGSVLPGVEVPASWRDVILKRADGNPLFVEEIARALKEAEGGSGDEVEIPKSLTGMLTARLDRLSEGSKYVVQLASVLGSEFDKSTLASLVDEPPDSTLTDLVRAGILIESPARPGHIHFRHALFQEAAYETILRRTRRELHDRVADHLVATDPEAAPEIARHLVSADNLSKAFPYLIDAGVLSLRSMALADAIERFSTALDNVPEGADPDLVDQAHDGLGDAYSLVPDLDHAAAVYQRLYDYGEETERPSTRVAALNRLAVATASLSADLEQAGEYLLQARALAEECDDEAGLAEYHMNACFVASLGGNLAQAVEHDEETVTLGEKTRVESVRLSGLVRRATNYVALLDLEKAPQAVAEAKAAVEEAGMEEAAAVVESFGAGLLILGTSDLEGYLDRAMSAQETLDRYGSFYAAMNRLNLASVQFLMGRLEDALSNLLECQRSAESSGQPFVLGGALSGMALVYAVAGMPEPIPDLITGTQERLDGPLGDFLASSGQANLGWVHLLQGQPGLARDRFEAGLGSSSITSHTERPRLLGGLALALLEEGDIEAASEAVAEARAFIEEKSFVLYNPIVKRVQGRLLSESGRLDEAESVLAEAAKEAGASGQRLEAAQISLARSRVSALAGNDSGAGEHRAAAIEVFEAIADEMLDQELRESYKARWLPELDPVS